MKYLILLLAFCTVTLGDFFSKRWVLTSNNKYVFISYSFYSLVTVLWFCLLKTNKDLGKSAVLWVTCGMLASIMLGVLYFNETLNIYNKVGVLLSLTGIVLVSLK